MRKNGFRVGGQHLWLPQATPFQGLHMTTLNLSILDPFAQILPNFTGTHGI